jgi:hypothetical protein
VPTRRFEVATAGVDEGLQGISSDPYGGSSPLATGIRIPSLVNTATTRYLVLLASRTISNGRTRICGIRQGLEIGLDLAPQLGITTERPVTFPVVTPTFRFSDGANVSWHLVKEPMIRRTNLQKLTDTDSWTYLSSDTPTFLYQTFTSSNVDALGRPIDYPLTLTAYTPPNYVNEWETIAGLRNIHDIRYPWDCDQAWDSIDERIDGDFRISLYASILQTNPATRPGIIYGTGIATNGSAVGGPPEEDFIYKYSFAAGEVLPKQGPQFWRVYGSILFEDEIAEDVYNLQHARIDKDRSKR